jgi:hypothetical protein
MMIEDMIAAVDAEIARLSQARKLLAGDDGVTGDVEPSSVTGKRTRSSETRARMAAAQQKRWAAIRKTEKKSAK